MGKIIAWIGLLAFLVILNVWLAKNHKIFFVLLVAFETACIYLIVDGINNRW
jgi:hypothetical protein